MAVTSSAKSVEAIANLVDLVGDEAVGRPPKFLSASMVGMPTTMV
eukprot:CAMPEP_0113631930 /NCGR_PEP_ID=MMETSP0017_2-20120614/16593_1 /TAXON_ID=2856 /ORGANISM="Cylindrotheca closterium" /LENGTH=44 /DNA_ID=CAMNT_0000542459 /DNA_START=81 /DNA_END=211 /DNA_ORIENTATION=- /assembly_acc=CAM_ASM_000147